jgi:hypothetical protein
MAMKLHQMTLPSAEELARKMGLGDLRIGKHYLREGPGEPKGTISICTFWFAEIMPTFHPRIALAAATASGTPSKDCCTPDWVKAVMATPEAAGVITLESDPMHQALIGVDLFCGDQSPPALNGIAYSITFQTMHLHGTLQFGNPTHRCLCALERAMFDVARQVATRCSDTALQGAMEGWRTLIQAKQERNPASVCSGATVN